MSEYTDLEQEVGAIFSGIWNKTAAQVVPKPEDLRLTNDAREFDRATILYADLAGSTDLVDTYSWEVAGEIYKSFLVCAAKLIRKFGGEITSYDGDRIMAVFIGNSQTTSAVKCALQINGAVTWVLNPALKKQYPHVDYTVRHVVGVDTSPIRAARIGVRGGNDLVWIGRAANYAAKLTNLDLGGFSTWISGDAYNQAHHSAKVFTDQQSMWKQHYWTAYKNIEIYGSTWWWRPFNTL